MATSFEADGYIFTYLDSSTKLIHCDDIFCSAVGTIEVKRKAGGEIQHFCLRHAREHFPRQKEKILAMISSSKYVWKIPPGPSPFFDFSNSVEFQKVLDTPADADAATRILSQRRTDSVYDKPDDPFDGDAILEARVVHHLAGKQGKQVLTKILRKMVKEGPGAAAKYLYQFMPHKFPMGRVIEKVTFEELRKK